MRDTTSSHVRWFLIFWLFILSAVAFLDRVNISVAGSSIADTYGLSDIQLGYVFSAFLAGYALFQTVGGRLADRLGPRKVLAAGVVWWGIFTALTAALPARLEYPVFFLIAIRFLLGAGEAVIYPASNQFVSRWIPTHERGIANGLIFAGVGAGAGLSPPFITLLMTHYGWRSSFWVCSLIGLLAGAVWFLTSRDDPREHPRVSSDELVAIQAGLAAANIEKPTAIVAWSRVLKSVDVWALTVSYFCYGYVAWVFFSWFYIYLAKVRGLNLKASAFYAMLPFLAMATACPIGGIVCDRLSRLAGRRMGRCGVAGASMAIAAAFIAVGSQVASARLASIVLAGGAGALYFSQSSFWAVTADIAGRSSGSVSGFMNMGAQLGGAITASLTPIIASRFGWTASFLVAAGLCVIGAVAWMLVNPETTLAEGIQQASVSNTKLGRGLVTSGINGSKDTAL
jgi:MFS transporter, ACS family, glucarate transporter